MQMGRVMKYGSIGGGLFMFGIVFGWMLFPALLKWGVHKQVNLGPKTDVRGLWSKFPFFLEFKVTIFNITNPDAITNGAKPIVQEVGPYFFEEWQEKVDLIDREEDDTVEYSIKNKWLFRPDLSNGLTGDEEIVVPHLFILAMVMAAVREKPSMVPIVNKAINSIFNKPTSLFVKIKAMDLLFNGLPIDCTVQDFAGAAVCSMVKENADDLIADGEDKYKFALFGAKNDTPAKKRVRVLRGRKNQMDVGVVVEYDGKNNISTWDDEYCDTFNGTDGTVFHPFFKEKEDIVSFGPDICRSLAITYEKKSKYKSFKTARYTLFLGDPDETPSQKCFCEAPDKCLGKGMMDLHKCAGVPMVLSHPHFYLADEKYLTMVDGLSPSKEKHELFLEFDSFTGSPLIAMKRVQINIMIRSVEKVKMMKTFPTALLPLFWIEEGVALPDWLLKQVKQGHTAVTVANFLKWTMILVGLGLSGFAGYLQFQSPSTSGKLQVTKIVSNNSPNSNKVSSADMNILSAHKLQAAAVPPALD